MLRSASPSVSDDIDYMVNGLLREDSDYDRTENRSSHREHLVRSVMIKLSNSTEELWSFSRNVSLAGIGLITDTPIPERRTADLSIERLDGTTAKVFAESRWCRPYGKHWHISGWQFMNLR